jgi:hypothetical protein
MAPKRGAKVKEYKLPKEEITYIQLTHATHDTNQVLQNFDASE